MTVTMTLYVGDRQGDQGWGLPAGGGQDTRGQRGDSINTNQSLVYAHTQQKQNTGSKWQNKEKIQKGTHEKLTPEKGAPPTGI